MPVITRRNGNTVDSSVSEQASKTMPRQAAPTTTNPSSQNVLLSLLPTPLEALFLAIYPTTLALGSLFSLLDPRARAAPYNPTTQSHPPAFAPAYFAKKSNFLNVYFVKVAWFWVSLAYVLFLLLHPSTGPRGLVLTPKRLRGMVRWAIVTGWWMIVTQWCFGPALIDRGFKITGGACELAAAYEGTGGGKEFLTSQACKQVGGLWKGGHDISGHVFILVLGSAFLGMEILPVLAGKRGLREERRVVRKSGDVVTMETEVVSSDGDAVRPGRLGVPIAVVGLSLWMLLMTAAYFHTWFEKFTGLLVAGVGIFTVYFLPRVFPSMREVIGMPGA